LVDLIKLSIMRIKNMRFEDLSPADQQLLNTDLGEVEKVAAENIALADEMYAHGFNKLAQEAADSLEAAYAAAASEKVASEETLDAESEKIATDLSAFIERGFFDGLRKLGSERYGDEAAYLRPFIEEKIAEAGAAAALAKVAGDTPEGHYIRRGLLGNALSSAIEAKPGEKLKAYGDAYSNSVKKTLGGAGKGLVGGSAVGGLAGAAHGAIKTPGNAKTKALAALAGAGKGALLGAGAGTAAGGLGGSLQGAFGSDASKIHGKYSENKKK
jgi:hypothetical protein